MKSLAYLESGDGRGEWSSHIDKRSRRRVYTNSVTGAVTYFKPQVMMSREEVARGSGVGMNLSRMLASRQEQALRAAAREDGKVPIWARPTQSLAADVVVTTVDTPIPPQNRGHRLLVKHGWRPGTGLGKREDGIVEPIRAVGTLGTSGLGVEAQDEAMHQAATNERKMLDIERELQGDAEVLQSVQEKQAKAQHIEAVVSKQNRPFYCALCDKQYKNTMEMQAHLNSYDHGHKARFKEMREMERARNSSLNSARRRQEQKRQERELRKRMEAAAAAQAARAATTGAAASAPASAASGSTSFALKPGKGRAKVSLGFGRVKKGGGKAAGTKRTGFKFTKKKRKGLASRGPVRGAVGLGFGFGGDDDD